MKEWKETAKRLWERYRYFLLVVAVGALLMLFSFPVSPEKETEKAAEDSADSFDLAEFEEQVMTSLSAIDGVGRVEVMLTLKSTAQSVYASDTQSSQSSSDASSSESSQTTMSILSDGSYGETPVLIQSNYPTFRGAVIICDGADDSEVCLEVTEAVSALCDLSSDHITIVKMSR